MIHRYQAAIYPRDSKQGYVKGSGALQGLGAGTGGGAGGHNVVHQENTLAVQPAAPASGKEGAHHVRAPLGVGETGLYSSLVDAA